MYKLLKELTMPHTTDPMSSQFVKYADDTITNHDFDDVKNPDFHDAAGYRKVNFDKHTEDEEFNSDEPVDDSEEELDSILGSLKQWLLSQRSEFKPTQIQDNPVPDTIDFSSQSIDSNEINVEDEEFANDFAEDPANDFEDSPSDSIEGSVGAGEEGIDQIDGDLSQDVRHISGARLLSKSMMDNGSYEELWVYTIGDKTVRDPKEIKKDILSAVNIEPHQLRSEDGNQWYEIVTVGNLQYINLFGIVS